MRNSSKLCSHLINYVGEKNQFKDLARNFMEIYVRSKLKVEICKFKVKRILVVKYIIVCLHSLMMSEISI